MVSIPAQTILTLMTIIRNRQLSHDSLNSRTEWNNVYDFVVVGAGTAGTVVAARLAEDSRKTILLIEAGGPQTVESDIPAFAHRSIETELDWNYPIVPQKNAFWAFEGQQRTISRGKGFGGCSMHNEMNYYRESPEYFDLWTQITGVKNWTYSDVLPYYKKSENNLDEDLVARDPSHQTGGELSITTALRNPLVEAYIVATNLTGTPMTHSDGREPFGTAVLQTTIEEGVRQSTSLILLEHNNRTNLHILGKTLVTKVLFDEKKRAIGVQFFRDNKFHEVFVKNEVIVSAGTIASPQLLLLSGIGPSKHLQRMKIPVISDLRVGDNHLQAPGLIIGFDIKDQSLVERPEETFQNYYNYFVNNSGPLTDLVATQTSFPQVTYQGNPKHNNGFLLVRTGFFGTDLDEEVKGFINKEEWKEYFRPYLNRSVFYMISVLKKPQKTGTIRLASNNPFQYPLIDPCIFCSKKDLNDLVKTVQLSLDIFLSPLLKPFIELNKKPIPGCKPCPNNHFCKAYIRCMLQTYSDETYPNGGCRIGIVTDKEAVVDQRLKVFGVSGLRVIDSSIIPVGTDQSTGITIMIGEYGADMIQEDNRMERNERA